MSDLISREDLLKQLGISDRFNADVPAWVIGVIKGMPSAEHHKLNIAEYIHDFYPDVWRHAEKELEVPSAERKGTWIKLDMHRGMEQYKCSACNSECYVPECMGEPLYMFCPICGADMRGEEDE